MAKWSDLARWCGPTVNQGGKMSEQRGVVLHIAEGSYAGTISWQKNPSAQVSSHFIAAKNGDACQMVDTSTVAWTQANGNGKWLSIENEGFVPDKLTDHQMEFAAQILARAHVVYGVPLQIASSPSGRGLGHHSMGCNDGWGHCSCPGDNIINQKSAIVARAKEIIEEANMPTPQEYAKAVWNQDQIPAPKPPNADPDYDTNPTWQADNALTRAVEMSTEAARLGHENAAKLDQVLAALSSGVPIPGAVNLTPESVAAVADATADEIHNDPERDG